MNKLSKRIYTKRDPTMTKQERATIARKSYYDTKGRIHLQKKRLSNALNIDFKDMEHISSMDELYIYAQNILISQGTIIKDAEPKRYFEVCCF